MRHSGSITIRTAIPTAPRAISLLPFDLGVTLPKVERYTDARFRRVARWFDPYKLDAETAVQLVAFLHVVPPKFAKFIFGWRRGFGAEALMLHEPFVEAAQDLVRANAESMTIEAGMAILRAMQDGGWTSRKGAPKFIKDLLRELRASGLSMPRVSALTGIPYDTVHEWSGKRDKWAVRAASREARGRVGLVFV